MRLAAEAGQAFGIVTEAFRKNLDGDFTAQLQVLGPIDLSHAPGTQVAEDLKGPYLLSGIQRHGWLQRFRVAAVYDKTGGNRSALCAVLVGTATGGSGGGSDGTGTRWC